ncbi:MAG: flagellar protein export ATPase FliI [Candidatus Hydrogenedentota bacterium]
MACPLTDTYLSMIPEIEHIRFTGAVTKIIGLVIEASGPRVPVGEVVLIKRKNKIQALKAEVVGFKENRVLLMPIGEMEGIAPGCEVIGTDHTLSIPVGPELLGRVLNGIGDPMDGKGALPCKERYSIYRNPPHPLKRRRVKEILSLGVRAIDGLFTVGRGQRMGIFSGSGVGKSTLLGMIARFTEADINVIGLIGERGREVRDFLEKDLQEDGLKKSVVVVATSDSPPLCRLRGAFVATAIAEYFRDIGKNVLLLFDSVTRFARAQREVGLAIGEPPAQRGFTPSVFEILPRLLERSGNSDRGSITGIYTVLVDGDDFTEPICDNVRGILDGHVILVRKLAERGQYPAIDVLGSISRIMVEIVDEYQFNKALKLKELVSVYQDAEDLINIGAYVKGSNTLIDESINKRNDIINYLKQGIYEKEDYIGSKEKLLKLF